ncbi:MULTISPECIES: tRNA (adenosine(37)-N6)-threonylcarbamoyltransferase complex ATPase subunit type 1 TsaE [unclassified Granulicatella]|uniref:tRNA (adenosine(37)-N6)-threonylcarbamoyltransferase complex ATPase subunit type 1 TsaE n=1 Tax=unclassified Granulicatella TaxID=2630493 RepID=UPI001072F623|nr:MULTISPECIES: tRNA (adenosine(37)-N6)-threonylcarbamoyltransferase complex ATPase subunit type 1 TsaE [unclassified Granulicatella]MBF0779855.1 tRNA (adenosine(37)-N6)-threonylcarbamoyltransferase complex ATPase subunit type 1 TsaE [Granulicatella sp. 19428wC4_WM01]TFU96059.1 tRNA (adenosine(37)-N6)-threonylcarbamoyltransferase complex ATPase subunit type 1 TsaE [Granulicatella sp. WM01]
MSNVKMIVQSETELRAWASKLAKELKMGMVILLHGELGAGKTTFTKGLAQGLGVSQTIKSPTYTLIKEYDTGVLTLYHMDMYRLEDIGGEGLGLIEYFEGDGVSVVEWSEFIQDDLPTEHLDIYIERVFEHDTYRQLTITATGKKYQELLNHLNIS